MFSQNELLNYLKHISPTKLFIRLTDPEIYLLLFRYFYPYVTLIHIQFNKILEKYNSYE